MLGNTGKQWHLFDISGHPVYVDAFFLILIGLFSFAGIRAGSGVEVLFRALMWAPTLFIGILVHELGHALTIQKFGFGDSRIILHGFGGVTINERRQSATPMQSVLISFAGPAASFLLGILSFGILLVYKGAGGIESASSLVSQAGFLAQFLGLMAIINIIWAIFNLLPINPMDGGHIVMHILRGTLRNRRKAMYYSATSSLAVLGFFVLIALVFGVIDLWLIFLAMIFGFQNWQMIKRLKQGGRPGMR
jgi:Zn-dependent protease